MDFFGADAIVFIFQIVGTVFNFVFGIFLILAGQLVDVATSFNFKILDADTNTILRVGWLAARDIANLGFVILAIGSALATVLRYPQDYDIRRLLPKFVAAAILVNFSMTLAAIPIQFSNILTGFFLSRVTAINDPSLATLSGPLVNILGPQKLLVGETDPLPPNPSDSAGGAVSAVIFASLATLIFNVVFTILMAILLISFAIMLISRYFILTFLIIFAPIACLAFVFPALKGALGEWTKAYTKWAFLGPSMMFFVYMAIVVAENLPGKSLAGGGNLAVSGLGGLMEQFINLSFVTAILTFGLLMAGRTGTAAGKGALGAATALGTGAKKFIKDRKDKFMEKGPQSKFTQGLQKRFKSTQEFFEVKDKDSDGMKFVKRMAGATGVGAAIGGNKKGLYGTLVGEMMVGSGLKDKKEKKPETKKDVDKEIGELQKQRAKLVENGLETKDLDEKIKVAQRKLYRYRREEAEADYSQATEEELNKAITESAYGKKPEKDAQDEGKMKVGKFGENQDQGIESIDLEDADKAQSEAQKIIEQEKQIKDDVKLFVKGIQKDPTDEKSEVIQTVSRKKLIEERKAVNEKVAKLKELKKSANAAKNKAAEQVYEKALGILQNAEYALDNEIKKREEEIQNIGSIRRRRENAEKQVENATKGIMGLGGEEDEEFKYGTGAEQDSV